MWAKIRKEGWAKLRKEVWTASVGENKEGSVTAKLSFDSCPLTSKAVLVWTAKLSFNKSCPLTAPLKLMQVDQQASICYLASNVDDEGEPW